MMATRAVLQRNRVITPSAAAAIALYETYRLPAGAVTVVPWGVDETFTCASSAVRSSDSHHAGRRRPPKGPYLLQVGARRPHKNVVTLVRALAHLPEAFQLVLAGPVDDRMPDPVPEVAEQLGVSHRIIHLEHADDAELVELYRGAHALVYPSLVEGFGLPLLEAMAVGTPVIASDIPIFREVSGGVARFVPALDPEAWAAAVMKLSSQNRAELSEGGRREARKATWGRTTDALLATVGPVVVGPSIEGPAA